MLAFMSFEFFWPFRFPPTKYTCPLGHGLHDHILSSGIGFWLLASGCSLDADVAEQSQFRLLVEQLLARVHEHISLSDGGCVGKGIVASGFWLLVTVRGGCDDSMQSAVESRRSRFVKCRSTGLSFHLLHGISNQ